MLRSWVSRFARTGAFSAAVGIAERLGRPRAGLLPVLTYHRVRDPARDPDLDPALISATPPDFALQIELLARSFRPLWDAEATGRVMARCAAVARRVPCLRLEFRPDRTAVDVVREVLRTSR